MRQILAIITLLILTFAPIHIRAQNYVLSPQSPYTWDTLPLRSKIKESLKKQIYAKSEVKTFKKKFEQSLDMLIAGLHKTSCSRALVKISQYERYKDFIDFIKESTYNTKNQEVAFVMDHPFLPFKMNLSFQIQRITKEGLYFFTFNKGFLAGLKGQIHISKKSGRCLFAIKAFWRGPDTEIPDSVLSFFSQALGQRAMERIFHISRTL